MFFLYSTLPTTPNEMRFKDGKLVADTKIRAGFAMRNQVESFIRGEKVFDSKGQRVKRFFFNKSGILFYEKEKSIINPKCVLSEFGSTKNGTNELFAILGKTNFDFPKPVNLIKFLIQLATNENSIVLDSFAGSGTTAHAVINLNQQDGGQRKFILIELMDYAETITAERVLRVGGSFDFYELGEPLFDEEGNVNKKIPREKFFDYVYFAETGKHYAPRDEENLLGVDGDIAYYYFDDAALDYDLLAKIKTRANYYIIYADKCTLSENFLDGHRITFKKIPRDIRRY